MDNSRESWGSASRAVRKDLSGKSAKSSESGWNMDRLTPMETKKTQANKFSYTGMTIIHRNGKK